MTDQTLRPRPPTALSALHLGAPTVVGPLTLFPIWTDAPVPEEPIPTQAPAGTNVAELEDGPSVEWLTAANPTAGAYALLEGTVVDGGWQHRVLVHSVLVAAGSTVQLPVRCIEQGRWHGDAGQHVHARRAPLGVRGAARGIRHDATPSHRRAEQGDVWSRVAAYERTYGASDTSSLVEVLDCVEVSDEVRGTVPAPLLGQRGVLVGVGGHPAVLEVFEHPDSLAQQWDPLIDGLLRSTLHVPVRVTPTRRARSFVERLSGRELPQAEPAGAGVVVSAEDDLVSVRALDTAAGRTVHVAALNVRHDLVLAA